MRELFTSHSGKLQIGQAAKTLVVQMKGVASVELHLPGGGDVLVVEAIDYSEPPQPKPEPKPKAPPKPKAAPANPVAKKRKAPQRKK